MYYAHSIRKYYLPIEADELHRIQEEFPNAIIRNPRDEIPMLDGSMEPFFEEIKRSQVLIFSEYKGSIGRGVYDEVMFAKKHHLKIWFLRNGKFHDKFDIRLDERKDWAIHYAKVIA